LETGLVSPQFHVRHDDFFETVRPNSQNPETLSHWQSLAGFKDDKKGIKVSEGDVMKGIVSDPVIPQTEELVSNVLDSTSQQNQQDDNQFLNNSDVIQDDIQTAEDTVIHTRTAASEPAIVKQTQTRVIKRPERLIEVAYSSYYEVLHEDDYKLQDETSDPIASWQEPATPTPCTFLRRFDNLIDKNLSKQS
jgi:hypothetical protein